MPASGIRKEPTRLPLLEQLKAAFEDVRPSSSWTARPERLSANNGSKAFCENLEGIGGEHGEVGFDREPVRI
jgi:hypothetical protein